MNTKEKLDLLWKYLLLAVIVYAVAQLGHPNPPLMHPHGGKCAPGHKMIWMEKDGLGDEINVDVQIEKLDNGDSTVKVIINGESMSLEDLEKLEDNVYMKKMKGGQDGKQVKVIKKKIITE